MRYKRTIPADNYIQPNDKDIREVAKRVGLKAYSPDFVRDIANVISGGKVLTSSEYMDDLLESIPEPKQDAEGYWQYPNSYGSYYTCNSYEDAKKYTEDFVLRNQEKVCEFIRTLDLENAVGDTPLQKACGVVKLLSGKGNAQQNSVNGESLPIFREYGDGRADKQADELNSINELVKTLDTEEREMLESDLDLEEGLDEDCDEDSDGDTEQVGGKGHGKGMIDIKLAEDMIKGRHHFLEISRNLDGLTRFRLGKSNKFEPDIEGDDINKRLIKGIEEIHKLQPVEYAMPESYRLFRVITRAAPVRERVIREGKKQLIYMIVDCSISMKSNNGERIYKAGGVLFNRLKAVLKGDAELYFRFFDTYLFDEYKATTEEEAKQALKTFRNKSFSGGGTWISNCLRGALSRIDSLLESEELSEKPELVIVTDGDDDIRDLTVEEFKDRNLRLHSFVVGGSNKKLTQLARDTGGVGVDKL